MLRVPALALFLIACLFTLHGSSQTEAKFAPSFRVELTEPAPEVPSDLTLEFRIELGEYQFAGIAFYLPLEWGVARGDSLPVGAQVGRIESVDTFGLINSACDVPVPLEFDLKNASLERSEQVSFGDSEMARGLDPDSQGYGVADFAEDRDGNGLVDAVDRYPDFLDEALRGAKPLARLAAVPPIAGVPALVQLLIFPPGTRFEGELGHLAAAVESGYPVVAMIDHWGTREGAREPSPITDHCTPLEASIRFHAAEGGQPLLMNPQSGVYQFELMVLSKGDADDDGIENDLDVCPFLANIGDPTVPNDGDSDGDGMDLACDPSDDPRAGGMNTDQDGDGYLNRQDNCPLIPNGSRPVSKDAQLDQDADNIGDVCDPDPEVPAGEPILYVPTVRVVVGEASGGGGPPERAACPQCYRPDGQPVVSTEDDSVGRLAVAAGLIAVGLAAGAVVLGGGVAYLIRRRRG